MTKGDLKDAREEFLGLYYECLDLGEKLSRAIDVIVRVRNLLHFGKVEDAIEIIDDFLLDADEKCVIID